jgi:hypothetical protein
MLRCLDAALPGASSSMRALRASPPMRFGVTSGTRTAELVGGEAPGAAGGRTSGGAASGGNGAATTGPARVESSAAAQGLVTNGVAGLPA